MVKALSVSRLVSATVNLQPMAAQRRGFGTLLILGDSDVISSGERLRSYTTLDAVAADFGLTAPEYYGAALYFGQSPRPAKLIIGRWIAVPTVAELRGGVLGESEQNMDLWRGITSGAFDITVDGVEVNVTGLDFSDQTNLNGVASVIDQALVAGFVSWDGTRFTVRGQTGGSTGAITYASDTSDSSLATMMRLTTATAAGVEGGKDAETPAAAVASFADMSSAWYGVTFCATKGIDDDQHLDVAAFVEGAGKARLYGVTVQDSRVLEATVDTDLGSQLKKRRYKRSPWVYSSTNPYAVCSLFGRAFSVNFSGNRTTITMMYKTMPGVVYESLSETQVQAIEAKNGNVYVYYDNDTAIIQRGVVPDGAYFDEVHGTDWLADAIQTALYNLLYQSKTKIPQTNEGTGLLVAAATQVLDQAVANGLVAPGIWNADSFGQLQRGDRLDSGYYIYMPDIDLQDQSEREARVAPLMQIAAKLAGAIHSCDVQIDMNR